MTGPMELENAAIDVGRCADVAGLIKLAAEGMIADGDEINGAKFYATAEMLSDRLADLRKQLDVCVEAWLRERNAAKT